MVWTCESCGIQIEYESTDPSKCVRYPLYACAIYISVYRFLFCPDYCPLIFAYDSLRRVNFCVNYRPWVTLSSICWCFSFMPSLQYVPCPLSWSSFSFVVVLSESWSSSCPFLGLSSSPRHEINWPFLALLFVAGSELPFLFVSRSSPRHELTELFLLFWRSFVGGLRRQYVSDPSFSCRGHHSMRFADLLFAFFGMIMGLQIAPATESEWPFLLL